MTFQTMVFAPALALLGLTLSPPAQTPLPGTEVVAVVERRAPNGAVAARRVLTREAFDVLSEQRARELTSGGDAPWIGEEENGEQGSEESAAPASELTDQQGIAAALGLDSAVVFELGAVEEPDPEPDPAPEEDLSVDEILTMAREAQAEDEPWVIRREEASVVDEEDVPQIQEDLARSGENYRELPPHLQQLITPFADRNSPTRQLEEQVRTLRLRQTEDDAERRLEIQMLRLQRRFESQVIDEWIDSALISLEAERQGHRVTETDIDAALLPMLQARLTQINRLEGEGDLSLSTAQIQRLRQTASTMENEGASMITLESRATLRDEIAHILTGQGVDPDQFYDELHDRILAESLIRSLIYDVYGEERLREHHREHQQEFVIPRRFQILTVKYLWQYDELPGEREETREAFGDLQRRLRRIDSDTALDEVVIEWERLMQEEDALPERTYVSLTRHQLLSDMPSEVASATLELDPGETSDVIELMPEAIQGGSGYSGGLAVVRLVDVLESSGWEFEEVRPRVEDVFFEDTRSYLVNLLKEQGPYREWSNRGGATLREALDDLHGQPRDPSPS